MRQCEQNCRDVAERAGKFLHWLALALGNQVISECLPKTMTHDDIEIQ